MPASAELPVHIESRWQLLMYNIHIYGNEGVCICVCVCVFGIRKHAHTGISDMLDHPAWYRIMEVILGIADHGQRVFMSIKAPHWQTDGTSTTGTVQISLHLLYEWHVTCTCVCVCDYLYSESSNNSWVERRVLLVLPVNQPIMGNETIGLSWFTPF